MAKTWPKSETEVAEPIVAWLIEMGWEVFQEVAGKAGPRADIVARRGRILWVIEVKRTLSLSLIGQGLEWRGRAHRVSLAYPLGRNSAAKRAAKHFAEVEGLGLIEVWRDLEYSRDYSKSVAVVKVEEVQRPALCRRAGNFPKLAEAQKAYAKAGNADGKFWSPFKETCARVARLVEAWPGLTVREVVDRIDHHYASAQSARGSLLSWAEAGKLEGVVVRGGSKVEGACRLYPANWHGPVRDRALLKAAIARRAVEVRSTDLDPAGMRW